MVINIFRKNLYREKDEVRDFRHFRALFDEKINLKRRFSWLKSLRIRNIKNQNSLQKVIQNQSPDRDDISRRKMTPTRGESEMTKVPEIGTVGNRKPKSRKSEFRSPSDTELDSRTRVLFRMSENHSKCLDSIQNVRFKPEKVLFRVRP